MGGPRTRTKIINLQKERDERKALENSKQVPKSKEMTMPSKIPRPSTALRPTASAGAVSQSHKPLPLQRNESSTVMGAAKSVSKPKLIVRGLKRVKERYSHGTPPLWTKEFPCRSRYHPDSFLFDSIEGDRSAKRGTDASQKCPRRGGRCYQCGISTMDLCITCRKCENDCTCRRKYTGSSGILSDALDRAREFLNNPNLSGDVKYYQKRDLVSSDSNPLITALGGKPPLRKPPSVEQLPLTISPSYNHMPQVQPMTYPYHQPFGGFYPSPSPAPYYPYGWPYHPQMPQPMYYPPPYYYSTPPPPPPMYTPPPPPTEFQNPQYSGSVIIN